MDAGQVLRLRKDANGSSLTLKGPSTFEGRVKVREEHETEVGDADAARALLEGLGYEMVKRYQKVREQWHLGGVSIALDHTPIGDFAEFEGDAADRVARRCGFEPDEAERRSYLRLYDDYRRDNPDAPEDMLFPDRTSALAPTAIRALAGVCPCRSLASAPLSSPPVSAPGCIRSPPSCPSRCCRSPGVR